MGKPLEYKDLASRENYDAVLQSGMFWEYFPGLCGSWKIDVEIITELLKLEKRYGKSTEDFMEEIKKTDSYPSNMDETDCAFWSALAGL